MLRTFCVNGFYVKGFCVKCVFCVKGFGGEVRAAGPSHRAGPVFRKHYCLENIVSLNTFLLKIF